MKPWLLYFRRRLLLRLVPVVTTTLQGINLGCQKGEPVADIRSRRRRPPSATATLSGCPQLGEVGTSWMPPATEKSFASGSPTP